MKSNVIVKSTVFLSQILEASDEGGEEDEPN